MQSPLPHSWPEIIFLLAGTLIGLIPQFISSYRNRRKSDLENVESEARAELTHAEARSLRIRDDLATGEGVGKMLTTLMEATDQIRDLQRRVIQAEADAKAAQMFVEQLNMAAKLRGVHLSDFTPEQLKGDGAKT